MKFLPRLVTSLIFAISFFFIATSQVLAEIESFTTPRIVDDNTPTVTLTFTGLNPNETYEILDDTQVIDHDGFKDIQADPGTESYTTPPVCGKNSDGRLKADCNTDFLNGDFFEHTTTYKYIIRKAESNDDEKDFSFRAQRVRISTVFDSSNLVPNSPIRLSLSGSIRAANDSDRNDYEVILEHKNTGDRIDRQVLDIPPELPPGGTAEYEYTPGVAVGTYIIRIDEEGENYEYHRIEFTIDPNGGEVISETSNEDFSGDGTPTQGRNPCSATSCPTALGDIPTDITAFAQKFLGIAIGLAGGIALIILVIGSIRVLTSSGDQQRLGGGRDMIVAAIAGLLFLIFSTLILKFIGVSILGGIV